MTLLQLTPSGAYGKLIGENGKLLEPITLKALPTGGRTFHRGWRTGAGELMATVSPEAGDPTENDTAKLVPGAVKGTTTDPQLAKADLTVSATIANNVLSVVIANKGTAPSTPNAYVIEAGGRGLGNGQVPTLQPNQVINLNPLTLAPTATPVTVAVRLTNPDGGQPDQVALVQPAAAVISKADLQVTLVANGGVATAKVTNIGKSPSAPGRTFSVRQLTPSGVYGKLAGVTSGFLEPTIMPGLAAGNSFMLTGKYTGTGELIATVSPEAGDPTENDTAKVVPGAPGGAQVNPIEQRLIQLVNAERAKNNLRPLTVNSKLMDAARGNSANQARQRKMDHILDGKNPLDRMTAAGYRPNLWLENIFAGRDTPEEAMQWWMNSPAHRSNLLNPDITEIGVGVQNGYWTQVFGRQQ